MSVRTSSATSPSTTWEFSQSSRSSDPELVHERRRCRSLLQAFNTEPEEEQRLALLQELLGRIGSGTFISGVVRKL